MLIMAAKSGRGRRNDCKRLSAVAVSALAGTLLRIPGLQISHLWFFNIRAPPR
jgi:hypothetical protein